MKYKIVEENTIEDLEKEVEKLIKDGWTLQGGVATDNIIIEETGAAFYTQAMVKVEGYDV